jgi:hypothetical protein
MNALAVCQTKTDLQAHFPAILLWHNLGWYERYLFHVCSHTYANKCTFISMFYQLYVIEHVYMWLNLLTNVHLLVHHINIFCWYVFQASFVKSCLVLSTRFLKCLQGMLYWYDAVATGNPELTECCEISSPLSFIWHWYFVFPSGFSCSVVDKKSS